VLIANGIVEPLKPGFGFEVTGVVKRVTPSVKNVAVGDRVMAYTEVGFSSKVVVLWQMCSKIPETLSFEDGATMPVVYGTVIYSLIDVGRLERGQVRILPFTSPTHLKLLSRACC
jgi:NADPH:quinone reductase-like Zn-dependent oxidoreductase